MEIHNLMEDSVNSLVGELFDSEAKNPALGFCTCAQCRLDVACYVLNRLAPEYVTSGRGVVHGETDWSGKVQKKADMITLAREGWTRINQQQRPQHHQSAPAAASDLPEGPVFNFPTIMGRLFHGTDFSPFEDVQVGLYRGEDLLPMMDPNWQNPCRIVRETEGAFIFWPRPISASAPGEEGVFQLRIHAEFPGFEAVSHYLELALIADATVVDQITAHGVHKLPDLYMFAK